MHYIPSKFTTPRLIRTHNHATHRYTTQSNHHTTAVQKDKLCNVFTAQVSVAGAFIASLAKRCLKLHCTWQRVDDSCGVKKVNGNAHVIRSK